MAQVIEKGPVVIEATDQNFLEAVVEESKARPGGRSRGEKPIGGFVGASPEPMVNEFIDKLMPSEAELEAEDALEVELDGDLEGAEQKDREAPDGDPNNRDARVGLGRG